MNNKFSMEAAQGVKNQYILKDDIGITLGRLFILEFHRDLKQGLFRFKLYKELKEDSIKSLIAFVTSSILKSTNLIKISIIADNSMVLRSAVEIGFIIEGILQDSQESGDTSKSQFIIGITNRDFNKLGMISGLTLKNTNIELKVLTPEYAKEILDYYLKNKDYLKPYEPARDLSFYTIEVQKNILAENYLQYLNGDSLNMGLFKDNILIGKIQLSNIVQGIFKSAVLGYSIDKDCQGHGYMKEAVNSMVEYGFNDLKLHRIEASTLVDNIKSQKVLKNCGFHEVGLNPNYLYINGDWRDHITFCKIR